MERLNKLKLKMALEEIKREYSHQKSNISGYLKNINDTFYEYGKVTDNFSYESVLNDIISGEDCEGYVTGAKPTDFYYWKNVNGKPTVTTVDYDLLTELVDEAFDLMEEKEKDYDIC